jgi:hypothetical protein
MYIALTIYLIFSGIYNAMYNFHQKHENARLFKLRTAKAIVNRLLENSAALRQIMNDYDGSMRNEIKASIVEYIEVNEQTFQPRQLAYLNFMIASL